jgi:hypothetical protein
VAGLVHRGKRSDKRHRHTLRHRIALLVSHLPPELTLFGCYHAIPCFAPFGGHAEVRFKMPTSVHRWVMIPTC